MKFVDPVTSLNCIEKSEINEYNADSYNWKPFCAYGTLPIDEITFDDANHIS